MMKMPIRKYASVGLCYFVFLQGGFSYVCRGEEKDSAAKEEDKRVTLWQGLMKACPPEYREIQVYATNPESTLVCFLSGRQTFIYSTETGKVEKVLHAKKLSPVINRITYDNDGFHLWYNGRVELSIGLGVEIEEGGADQPATVPQLKPSDHSTPNTESKPRRQ